MSTRERASDRGARLAGHDLVAIGTEIRNARLSASLTQRTVARACGMSYTQIGRIERAVLRSVSVVQLARIGAVVGLDVRVKAYPGPAAIRDAGQVALLGRFREVLHPRLTLRLEVPIPIDGDQRAWDGMVVGLVAGPTPTMPAEVETRLYDVQGQLRRVTLKLRDAGIDHVLLIVAGTRSNRRVVREAWSLLAPMFPVSGRQALAALRAGRHPGASALIFL